MKKISVLLTLCTVCLLLLQTSCKKPVIFSKGNLAFSVDTLVFDTVFTTIGSTTHQLKIYNQEKQTIKIQEVELMGGSNSPFRINLDGLKGTNFADIELEGKDSLFAFIEVTLDVNGSVNPMVIQDSIRFRSNGKDQYVQLVVWGQDAYFHYRDLNEGTWPADKPHVIYGYAAVDSAKTLNIQAGTQIYLHKGAILYVYKGTLNIQGTINNEVVLQGDRLEGLYSEVAGQYYGIYFQEARPSTINYAVIKNGTAGIHLFSQDPGNGSNYTLTVKNSRIFNNASYGIFIYSGAKVKAENCILSKNGAHALLMLEGGGFNFNHCHLLGYNSGNTQTPAVGISNYFNDQAKNVTNYGPITEGKLYNCAIYGTLATELVFDTINPNNTVNINLDVRNCLIKKEVVGTQSHYQSITWNTNPEFKDVFKSDFHFYSSSPLNGKANPTFSLPTDIEGNTRSITAPDIGAYEMY